MHQRYIKYLKIYLTKKLKAYSLKNIRYLLKEIEDLNNWKNTPCSCVHESEALLCIPEKEKPPHLSIDATKSLSDSQLTSQN